MERLRRWMVVVLIVMVFLPLMHGAMAEKEPEIRWVMCNPESYVVIREKPKKSGTECGYLLYGDDVKIDGKQRNGYWHVVDCSTEFGEGWVKGLYLVAEPPEAPDEEIYVVVSRGRLAARNGVNGERRRWLKPGTEVIVYGKTSEWAVTNLGYVKIEYLDLEE